MKSSSTSSSQLDQSAESIRTLFLRLQGVFCFCTHAGQISSKAVPFAVTQCPTLEGSRLTLIPAVGAPRSASGKVRQAFHNAACRSVGTQESRQNYGN